MLGSSSSAAAAISPPSQTQKYDVFLSFRGEDTRDNFISHLYAELIHLYDESMIYVVVLSENYASSTWCLDELTHILQCKEKYSERLVIPVFYKVDPSNVSHQKHSFAEAFVKHDRRFKDYQVNAWKAALTQVAGLSCWASQKTRSLFYHQSIFSFWCSICLQLFHGSFE